MSEDQIIIEDDSVLEEMVDNDEQIIENSDGTRTLVLSHPFEVKFRKNGHDESRRIDSLTFRRMNGGDMRAVAQERDEIKQVAILIARLSGHPEKIFDLMDTADIAACTEALEDFLPSAHATGKTS